MLARTDSNTAAPTTFFALQDVSEDMGPTFVLPGTHSEEAHARSSACLGATAGLY